MKTEKLSGPWKGRPMSGPPQGIIVHSMGEFIAGEYAPDFLKRVGLSVHAFIGTDGTILMAAPTNRQTFHAGRSRFKGVSDLNRTFLGFELLVKGDHNLATFTQAITNGDPYTEEQYQAAADLCRFWREQFPGIPPENIVGHSEVSGPEVRPDAKIDPGKAFNWEKFRNLL